MASPELLHRMLASCCTWLPALLLPYALECFDLLHMQLITALSMVTACNINGRNALFNAGQMLLPATLLHGCMPAGMQAATLSCRRCVPLSA